MNPEGASVNLEGDISTNPKKISPKHPPKEIPSTKTTSSPHPKNKFPKTPSQRRRLTTKTILPVVQLYKDTTRNQETSKLTNPNFTSSSTSQGQTPGNLQIDQPQLLPSKTGQWFAFKMSEKEETELDGRVEELRAQNEELATEIG